MAGVLPHTQKAVAQSWVAQHAAPQAQVYTDQHSSYKGMPFAHTTIIHSVGQYINGMAHTNGIESFWAIRKRGYYGTYYRMSREHLHGYINEFAGRQNHRTADTVDQMKRMAHGMTGKHLPYKKLVGKA